MRIAKGSGTSVTDVNSLVNRFEQAAKMMKTVARGGVPQLPGMGPGFTAGMGAGMAGSSKKKDKKKKAGGKSGNPAKRAAEAAGLTYQSEPKSDGNAFGL
jgi:signal recognition particle subunit SRP54